MNKNIRNFILNSTGSEAIISAEHIQSLWSGYGEILKLKLQGNKLSGAVIKYIVLPEKVSHPTGRNNPGSHARKIKSYEVEMNWYSSLVNLCTNECRVPVCYGVKREGPIFVIILEDLDFAGYSSRKTRLDKFEAQVCLKWLANFHAVFLGMEPGNLWETGTYWHLATRPGELAVMTDPDLKKFAGVIDSLLNGCKFKTIVHGDAKLANFCFSKNGNSVAVVDFQYVGGGCGMKDVAYFLDSALSEGQCLEWESELIDYYFRELKIAFLNLGKKGSFDELENEWRNLYSLCWADFYRFLSGWMPGNNHYNAFNHKVIRKALEQISNENML